MAVAGAFWVGVLAARHIRDWGDGRRALEERDVLALAPAAGVPPDDDRTRRVRDLVARRLQARLDGGHAPVEARTARMPREGDHESDAALDLGLDRLRVRDVVSLDGVGAEADGDYLVEGLVHLREAGEGTTVVTLSDAPRVRWLIGRSGDDRWWWVEPLAAHGLVGEPPRQLLLGGRRYTLERRGQASAAGVGRHGRPEGSRVATYQYRAGADDVAWVERWGDRVLVGSGTAISAHAVAFLPGS
jgi:hypothetical protein